MPIKFREVLSGYDPNDTMDLSDTLLRWIEILSTNYHEKSLTIIRQARLYNKMNAVFYSGLLLNTVLRPIQQPT